jgi:hypothetical protein
MCAGWIIGLTSLCAVGSANAEPGCRIEDGVVRVAPGTRVRFPYQKPGTDSEGPTWSVVRVQTSSEGTVQQDSNKVLVALRHARSSAEVIREIALASDRSLSMIVGRILARGRPSTDTERNLNQIVERDEENANTWTTDRIGAFVDQAYYLKPAEIGRLEQLAKAEEMSAGLVVDILVHRKLAKLGAM